VSIASHHHVEQALRSHVKLRIVGVVLEESTATTGFPDGAGGSEAEEQTERGRASKRWVDAPVTLDLRSGQ
jgi:hypothetical protein